MSAAEGTDRSRVRIPADVEREDRLLAGLTARQIALLAGPAVALWATYLALADRVPVGVFAAVAVPLGVVVVTVALGWRDGLSLDRWLLAAWRQRRSARHLVATDTDDTIEAAPAWLGPTSGPLPAPLRLPVVGISDDGTVGLGEHGAALMCRASTVNLALRTPTEQAAAVAVFARYLNSLTEPIEVVVRTEPVDLDPAVDELRSDAGGLPHPRLETAALAHAEFLTNLAQGRDLFQREVVLVLRDARTDADAPARLLRRAEDAATALAGAGITVDRLDGPAVANVLAAALNNPTPTDATGPGGDDVVIGAVS